MPFDGLQVVLEVEDGDVAEVTVEAVDFLECAGGEGRGREDGDGGFVVRVCG